MWPRKFWDKVYEPFIRAAAGLGKAPAVPDPDRYANRHAHCDVLVVGAGPAGLAAALAAARTGKRVILADEGRSPAARCCTTSPPRSRGTRRRMAERDAPSSIPRERHPALPHHGVRLLQPQPRRAGRADHRPLPNPGTAPRERLWQVRAGEVCAGRRLARAPAGLRRQRPAPASCSRERAGVHQPLRRRAGPADRVRDERRLGLCGGPRRQGGGARRDARRPAQRLRVGPELARSRPPGSRS